MPMSKPRKIRLLSFSILALGIACLGLLGMISNKAVEKTKEIGIRKILGAGLLNIARLLLMTTTKQIIIANIIGIPLAYYLVTQYLQKFSERRPAMVALRGTCAVVYDHHACHNCFGVI